MNKICVLGSMNMDLVMKIKDMPKSGETILSKSYEKIPGGKGANQAVAAKRSGAYVSMIAKIGKDDYGRTLRDELKNDDINIDYVFEDDSNATGTAMIMVADTGNNSIIVNPGSNMSINEKEIDSTLDRIKESDILIAQFETPEEMSLRAFKNAKENEKITILNPAPAKKIKDELLSVTDIIVPNETEAEVLTGVTVENVEDAKKAAKVFMDKGVKFVIITMGSKGAAVIGKDFCELVPAYKVNAIDTTAAGDSFIGGLSTKLNPNEITKENLLMSVKFGNMVSSIAVQREGAQPSIPYKKEVVKVYGEE
ncbi:ribokinase [Clostridium botulinum]|uniref:Ribokinase n=1 Tax=Clostridium botulinum TaxID=1491 RepID=A0A6B4JLL4_CLOBO|nr:ribokinase [Clostridium botulinum]EES50240.1 ribokinase [Clostridium botulinum E1 str. 'BoNT E Beluga']MBY6761039.1 ribokinase [Clostridium botulinum]MBY6919669.1 ribokinase [Clostridium botulinum]MCR1130833.1 ribokinase [Clostridium botulinum]NFH69450.1 ribokinase [Clostridium botulinum]